MSLGTHAIGARGDARGWLARGGLFVAGLALAAWLVRDAGPMRVVDTSLDAGQWLIVVVLLEVVIVFADLVAARALVADTAKAVSATTWARSSALAYAWSILLPAGRAAGEAVRATMLSSSIGLARSSRACARLQAVALLANGVISLTISGVVFGERGSFALAVACAINALLCASFGATLLLLTHSERLARWLGTRFPRFAGTGPKATSTSMPGRLHGAMIACVFGRFVQAVQYGVVLRAVGGLATPVSALMTQGIHLVGATVGDVVPSQMGVMEGAYHQFAGALGMAAAPARALSIALIMRVAQLALASSFLLLGTFLLRQPRAAAVP